MRLPRFPTLMTGSLVGALLLPASALAHDLRSKLTIDGSTVKVEGWYDDDTPAEKAKVRVTDAAGATVVQGVLDERGVWSFPRPGPGEYEVEVQSAGHRDSQRFTVPGAMTEDRAPVVVTSWRLDKRLGVAAGLAVIGLLTLAVWLVRRKSTNDTGSG